MPRTKKNFQRILQRPGQLFLLSTVLLSLTALAYFRPWRTTSPAEEAFSPDFPTHDTIPPISNEHPIIQHTFEKNGLKCITTYNITHSLPIHIKRYYPNEERTEYLILKPIDVRKQHINAVYHLVKNSLDHIGGFEPQVVSMYSNTLQIRYILWSNHQRMQKESGYLHVGVWHRKEGENTERLVAVLTIVPQEPPTEESDELQIPPGAYGSYWTGDPAYIQVKGVAGVSYEALINHLVYKDLINDDIVLIMDKNNRGSNNIAERLHFKKYEAQDLYPKDQWPYPSPIERCYFYRISKKKWIKYNWKKNEIQRPAAAEPTAAQED